MIQEHGTEIHAISSRGARQQGSERCCLGFADLRSGKELGMRHRHEVGVKTTVKAFVEL